MDSNQTPAEFFAAGGSLHYNLPSYVTRPADEELLRQLLAGNFCYLLTPRQMGKSSLMVRTAQKLEQNGVKTIILDLTTIGTASPDQWYQSLLRGIKRRLNLSINPKRWWQEHNEVSQVQRFIDYLGEVALTEVKTQIVIFIDEIDYTLHFDFKDDFFAAIRATYNARAHNDVFKRLTFVLLGAASPSDLMKDHRHTPFNVGHRITLREFSKEDAQVLQDGLELFHPDRGEPIFSRIYDWTGGHPYLTQKLCLTVAESDDRAWAQTQIDELVAQLFLSTEVNESEEDNLKSVQSQILEHPQRRKLLKLYKRIYQGQPVADDPQSLLHNQLKLSGLVTTEQGRLRVRNQIYRQVFGLAWIKANLPFYLEHLERIIVVTVIAALVFVAGFVIWQGSQQPGKEVLAQAYEDNFENTANSTLRLDNLTNLFGLPGYDGRARALFNSLLPAEKVALFSEATPDLQPQLRAVIKGTYTELSDTEANNELLTAMHSALSRSDEADSTILANEIARWLDGRAAVAQEEWSSAKIAFDNAIGLNDGNPATHYERALVLVALADYENALAELDIVIKLDERRQAQVRQTLLNHPELYDVLWLHQDEFAAVIALVPTPTSTSTPTETPTPPATPTPAPPTVRPTSRPSPTPATPPPSPVPKTPTPAPLSRQRFVFSNETDIFASYRDGTGTRQLTFTAEEEYWPAWSPDGEKIVFERAWAPGADGDLWIMDADGRHQTQVTFTAPAQDNFMPVWSPDGASIVFIHQGGVAEIKPDGSDLRFIVPSGETAKVNPVISPDGTRIAYNEILPSWGGPPPFTPTIVVVNRDGSGRKVVHTGPQRESTADEDRYFPAWSPDGTKIGFQEFDGVNYIVAATGEAKPVVIRESIQSWYPTYWPQWDGAAVSSTVATPDTHVRAAIQSAQADPQAAFTVAALQAAADHTPTRDDDFSDPSSGFGQIGLKDGFTRYENGVYLMENQPDACCVTSNIIGGYTDLVVQMDMRVDIVERDFPYFGAFSLRRTLAGYYVFNLNYSGSKMGYSLGYDLATSDYVELASGLLPDGLDTAVDTWHNLIAVVASNQIAYFVDGSLVAVVTDDNLSQGGIAMYAGRGSAVQVDNLRLWDINDLSP